MFVLHSIVCFIYGIIKKNILERKTSVVLPLLKETLQRKTRPVCQTVSTACHFLTGTRKAFIFLDISALREFVWAQKYVYRS